MLRALTIWPPLLIYNPIIFVLSLRPMPDYIPGNMDKLMHLGAYSIVGVLFTRVLIDGLKVKKKNNAVALALILSISMGALIEILQHFVPFRQTSFLDMLANALGALIGVYLYINILKPNKGQRHASS